MRLSSLADYAVVMLTAAARRCGGSACSAATIAGETGVPLPTAQKLVSRLAAAGLVESARGTGGGFRLARPAAAISLADIVEAVEGPIRLTSCVEGAAHDCGLDHQCHVKPHWGVVNEAVRGALAGISLSQLSTVRPELVEPEAGVAQRRVPGTRASIGSALTGMMVSEVSQ